MVIVLIHNPTPEQPNAQPMLHLENASTPEHALQVLQWAEALITQQLAGPKVFLPNGQAHIVPPKIEPPQANQ
jgi:hypothetical protein